MDKYRELFSKKLPFWDKMSDDEKNLLLNNTRLVKYKKGMNVHNGSEDCVGMAFVKSGQLRIYMISEDGKEITLYRIFQGETCVMSASCALNTITFDVSIDAEEDSEVLFINSSAFYSLIKGNIYVENFSYKAATERFSDVMWAMQQILFMSFDRRLAVFIMDELSRNGSDEIKMTHDQIARYMGSAREVVTRMLKYFADEGIVELSRGTIKIKDRKKLKELI